MAELPAEIERVVREVVAELLRAAGPGSAPQPSAPRSEISEPESQISNGKSQVRNPESDMAAVGAGEEFVIRQRVVTLAALPERWGGVRRVVVPHRAVVTPAVRDVLDQNRLALVYAAQAHRAANAQANVHLVALGKSYDPANLAEALRSEGFEAQTRRMDCLIAASDHLAEQLRDESAMGLLVARHAAAAMCLANRLAGVRAVRGTGVDAVVAEAEAVGANLLVLDPQAHGFYPLRQMALGFLRGGPRKCPEMFLKRLG